MVVFHFGQNVYEPLPAKHHTRRIWGELAKGCVDYHVIASSGKLTYSHTVDGNVHLHLLPSLGQKGWPFFFTSWLGLILGFVYRPNRIVAQCPTNGGIAAVVLGWLLKAPVLIEIHGDHYFSPFSRRVKNLISTAFYRLTAHLSFAGATRIRSLSSDMTDCVARIYGRRASRKVVEVGNRVDLGVFGGLKTDYGLGEEVVLVSVGAFTRRKGHLALIEQVLPAHPNLRLVLVGRGELERTYLDAAIRLGVSDRLTLVFASTHSEVAAILAASDLYVHPSLAEGVPRAILEAMALGLPVVATRVGFLGGVVEDARDIILVPPFDASRLVECIGQLIESEPLRRQIGTAAAQTIRDRCEWNAVFERYRAIIQTMRRS